MGTATSEAGRDESPVTAQEDPLGAGAVHAPIGEPLPHPEQRAIELASVLHALSDPMRLQIVAELAAAGGERACNSFNLPIVKSTCTHHFKVLREAGLIRQRVVGTSRVNSLRRRDLDTRFPGLLDSVLSGIG